MGNLRDQHLFGLLVPYPDLHEFETANDGTTNNSSYTVASPRPGVATPDDELTTLVPVISGAQDADLVLQVLKSGSPGITGDAVQIGYRYASETGDKLRGWTTPNGLVGHEIARWTTTAYSDYLDAAVHPNDQRVIVAYDTGTSGTLGFVRWDPDTAVWSALSNLTGVNEDNATMCALPNGRILLFTGAQEAHRSDDAGATWDPHSLDGVPNLEGMRCVAVDGELLLVGLGIGTETLNQYASSDGGASFTLVGTSANFGTKLSLCPLPDGRIVIVYRRQSDGAVYARRISSPWDLISDAATVVISASAHTDVAASSDPDGFIVVYGTLTSALLGMYVWVSVDYGESFGAFSYGAASVSTSSLDSLRPLKAVSTQGQTIVLCKSVASTSAADPALLGIRFGGWNNAPYEIGSGLTGFRARAGFGPVSGYTPIAYFPFELPNNAGWTLGGAGTATLTSAGLNLSTSANTLEYSWLPGTNMSQLCIAGLTVNSGGALTTRQCAITVAVANGSSEYRCDIRFTTTGFRVFDPNASGGAGVVLADITYDLTDPLDIMIFVTENASSSYVLYRRPYESAWTEAWEGSLTNDASPSASGIVNWGHIATGTANSDWRYVATLEGPANTRGLTSYQGRKLGRPISIDPVPLHGEVTDALRVGRISAVGGEGALDETFECLAEYDRPSSAIYPQVSPSPAAKWRSTSAAEQRRAWLLDRAATLGDVHHGIIAIGCNFRTAYLEYESSGWNIVSTLDLAQGFAGINYTLDSTGGFLLANAGGTAPGRYLKKDELAGGYAVIETGAGTGTIAKRIVRNDEGFWTSSTTRRRARVYLEGLAGTEDASGQCDLVFPSGLALAYESSVLSYRRWRIRIPSGQTLVDDYFEAGILVPAALHVPGNPPDWAYSEDRRPNVSSRRTPYGTSHTRELGPPIRVLSFGWQEGGAALVELRRSATDGDYVGISGQLPMNSVEEVAWWAEAIQRICKSGEIPIVAIKSLPAADTTINDQSLWHYGRLTSSVGYDHELGNEDDGETVRPIGWTIEGIS